MARIRATTDRFFLQMALCLIPLALCGCGNAGSRGQSAADRTYGRDNASGSSAPDQAPDQAGPSAALMYDTMWLLVDLGGTPPAAPAGVDVRDPRNRPRLKFDARAKRVSGGTGLNSFDGPYESSGGDALTFGVLATTRRAGEPELMTQEAAFLNALDSTAAARVTESTLRLLDEAGRELARFEPLQSAP
jgi:heat shock protein HslJ